LLVRLVPPSLHESVIVGLVAITTGVANNLQDFCAGKKRCISTLPFIVPPFTLPIFAVPEAVDINTKLSFVVNVLPAVTKLTWSVTFTGATPAAMVELPLIEIFFTVFVVRLKLNLPQLNLRSQE
jgi:hypothetical protein